MRLISARDKPIDDLTDADLLNDFSDLSETHSWSSIKLDLYGLKFYHEHVPKEPWVAPGLVQPPRAQRLPDSVTVEEAERISGRHGYSAIASSSHALQSRPVSGRRVAA
ncbi:MAG: hypothetical protein V5B32_12105 [Candidatus Accumulibacter sp. UW26]|jgi:hypothetical protein